MSALFLSKLSYLHTSATSLPLLMFSPQGNSWDGSNTHQDPFGMDSNESHKTVWKLNHGQRAQI